MKQLLIVEDDIELNKGLCRALQSEELRVCSCSNIKSAKEQLSMGGVTMALLDVNLPDGSGLELLKEIKKASPGTPVIMLTANDTDMDIVDGLEMGADDYITKPFSLSVLRARVNTQLRKASVGTGEKAMRSPDVYSDKDYSLDFIKMQFIVKGVSVELSKTEQKLLRILVENAGITLSRADLVDRIWTDGAEYVDENALSVTVKRLRDKLDAGEHIKTVYGIGYSWVK